MKRIRQAFIGFIVIFLAFIILGGIEGYGFFMLSIICTFGFSLFVYIPLAYAIGFMVENIFYVITGRKEKNELMGVKLDVADRAVINYINEAKKAGIAGSVIKTNLLENGWSVEVIDRAWKIVGRK